ncbi:MAG: hypothetical protein IJQ98_05635, partial [Oscillospiraceae bacterium]|nr:hypothetical protein [Oscillospiraceae bacterium]
QKISACCAVGNADRATLFTICIFSDVQWGNGMMRLPCYGPLRVFERLTSWKLAGLYGCFEVFRAAK